MFKHVVPTDLRVPPRLLPDVWQPGDVIGRLPTELRPSSIHVFAVPVGSAPFWPNPSFDDLANL